VLSDQAIYTSSSRRGKAGYHLVARSPGVTESEAAALTNWCPSHGGLIADGSNRTSVNFFPLPTGRFAVARTREGRAEYSGRGAREVFTRAVVVDAARLRRAGYQPFAVYRDALALGYLAYDPDPEPVLAPVGLSSVYPPSRPDEPFAGFGRELGDAVLASALTQLESGRQVVLPYAGDRATLAEFLIARLPPESALSTSFATSLHPSTVRPFTLSLVGVG
jgi:hypothetical protein